MEGGRIQVGLAGYKAAFLGRQACLGMPDPRTMNKDQISVWEAPLERVCMTQSEYDLGCGAHRLTEGSTILGALQRDNPRSVLEESDISVGSVSIYSLSSMLQPWREHGYRPPFGSRVCAQVGKALHPGL